jgi:hypothetical protein
MLLMLLVDAAIIGLIIAVMEQEEFPGWGPMLGAALLIAVAGSAAEHALPGIPGILASCVAAGLVGAVVISWLCGMSFRRAAIATSIYLTIKFLLGMAVFLMTRSVEA